LALAVETPLFLPFDVGVVAPLLVVFHVFAGGFTNELSDLIFRQRRCRRSGVGSRIRRLSAKSSPLGQKPGPTEKLQKPRT
jgi:hypothetical protein